MDDSRDPAAAPPEECPWAMEGARSGVYARQVPADAAGDPDAIRAGARKVPDPTELDGADIQVGDVVYRYLALPRREPQLPTCLTDTERAVAELVALGHSAQEIARVRHTSRRTIENQLASVYRKLNVSSRSELCALAFWECADED